MSILLIHSERGKSAVSRLKRCDAILNEALQQPFMREVDLAALRQIRAEGIAMLRIVEDATVVDNVKLGGFSDLLNAAEQYCDAVELEFENSTSRG